MELELLAQIDWQRFLAGKLQEILSQFCFDYPDIILAVDLSTLSPEQLAVVKQQLDQEIQHFSQSLQALNMAKTKFTECIEDVKQVSSISESKKQPILVPGSSSLYIPGEIVESKSFMVDIGTGYYVEKTDEEAIAFYQKKIDKLNTESVQIQNIIKEKSQTSLLLENQIRQAAFTRHEQSKANETKA